MFARKQKRETWEEVKEKCSPAVVAIEMNYPRSFGFDSTGQGVASGFVVDKENGIILTNKHVIKDGPVRARAHFLRNEEVDLIPVYRDPIHDFGFFKFDTTKLMKTPLAEISLNPEDAITGKKVLVLGNNAGEKLTYVDSTLARVDKTLDSPIGINTFFISATDITVGGASGGPVVNQAGEAVAMTCAGVVMTNSSYYLPLERVARALKLYQEGNDISRGTLQIGFLHKTYEELSRMGLPFGYIARARARFPDSDGMLVVHRLLPGGTGFKGGIRSGDILQTLNNNLLHNYVQLLEELDSSVNKNIPVQVIRDGVPLEFSVTVQDLYEVTPSEFIEVSDSVVHSLEYRLALLHNVPVSGVFLARSGYMFEQLRVHTGQAYAVITGIGTHTISDLDSFQHAISSYRDGEEVSMRFFSIYDKSRTCVRSITIDKRWHPFQRAKRNDETGKWEYKACEQNAKEGVSLLLRKTFSINGEPNTTTDSEAVPQPNKKLNTPVVLDAVVSVRFTAPFAIDGGNRRNAIGAGVIVDADLGLVLVDRDTVSSSFGDTTVTFNSLRRVRANAIFIHPTSLFAIIKYDPAEIRKDKLLQISSLELSSTPIQAGDKVTFVGIGLKDKRIQSECEVTSTTRDYIHSTAYKPKFTPRNIECFQTSLKAAGNGGSFVDQSKVLRGFNFYCSDDKFRGMCASQVLPYLKMVQDSLNAGELPPNRITTLPVHLATVPLVDARSTLKLSDKRASALLATLDKFDRSVLSVSRTMVSSDSHLKLRENDIVLAINDKPVTSYRTFSKETDRDVVSLTVLREEEEMKIDELRTSQLSTVGSERVLLFAGMILQPAHPDVAFLGTLPDKFENGGVYLTSICDGSPVSAEQAQSNMSRENSFIIKVENEDVSCLDDLIQAVQKFKHDQFIRLSSLDVSSEKVSVYSVRLDLEYWKTREFTRDSDGNWNARFIK